MLIHLNLASSRLTNSNEFVQRDLEKFLSREENLSKKFKENVKQEINNENNLLKYQKQQNILKGASSKNESLNSQQQIYAPSIKTPIVIIKEKSKKHRKSAQDIETVDSNQIPATSAGSTSSKNDIYFPINTSEIIEPNNMDEVYKKFEIIDDLVKNSNIYEKFNESNDPNAISEKLSDFDQINSYLSSLKQLINIETFNLASTSEIDTKTQQKSSKAKNEKRSSSKKSRSKLSKQDKIIINEVLTNSSNASFYEQAYLINNQLFEPKLDDYYDQDIAELIKTMANDGTILMQHHANQHLQHPRRVSSNRRSFKSNSVGASRSKSPKQNTSASTKQVNMLNQPDNLVLTTQTKLTSSGHHSKDKLRRKN
jgi:hypothetical protein